MHLYHTDLKTYKSFGRSAMENKDALGLHSTLEGQIQTTNFTSPKIKLDGCIVTHHMKSDFCKTG